MRITCWVTIDDDDKLYLQDAPPPKAARSVELTLSGDAADIHATLAPLNGGRRGAGEAILGRMTAALSGFGEWEDDDDE